MLAFQTADIYQVQAFRGHEKQYMRLASAWSVVFLIVIGASFFAKAGEMFSRVWLGTFYRRRPRRADRSRAACCSRWCATGRAKAASTAAPSSSAAASPAPRVIEELRRQKDSGVEIIGLFDDRGDDRARADAPASASSARSTISSNSAAARASIS